MIPKSFAVIYIGVLCLGTSLWQTVGQQQECASNVSDCVTVAFDVFNNHAHDIPLVCKTMDEFLMCIVEETRTCDPFVAASIRESMSPMLDVYTAEPYNCKLESANNEALQPDKCSEEMSYCSVYYLQAQSEAVADYKGACRLFEDYLVCMDSNTTSCGPDMKTFIKDHLANATTEFDKAPLYCEERLQYPLDEVESNMTACDQILHTMDIQYAKQDYVCGRYRRYFDCSVQALIYASPRQFQNYIQQVNGISESFRTRPYFCDSERPCMELFKDCNQSAVIPNMPPCQFMDVYWSCLSNANQYCGEAEYITLSTDTQILVGELHNTYNCIEENKNKYFTEAPTTTPEAHNEINNNNNNNDMENSRNLDNKPEEPMADNNPIQNDDSTVNTADTDGNAVTELSHENSHTQTNSVTEDPPPKDGNNNNNNNNNNNIDDNVMVADDPATSIDDTMTSQTEQERENEKEGGSKVSETSPKGSGNSESKQNTSHNDDGENGGSVLKGSVWALMMTTLCLLVAMETL